MSEGEIIKPKRKIKAWHILVIFIVLLLAFVAISANMDVFVKWFVTDNVAPEVSLEHPDDNEVFSVNQTYFNWTSTDINGDILYHVYYADMSTLFTSPFYRSVDVNTTTNYTANPFTDGVWYWRVEVTDNESVVVSETRRFYIRTNPTNNFPNLTDPGFTPATGYEDTTFTYKVTFNDLDNDTADYVRVFIDGVQYNMTESDLSDTNTTDGKNYSYSTTLSAGSHDYQFTCFDGNATNVTSLYSGPVVNSGTTPGDDDDDSGGGGGGSSTNKMNKISLQPDNYKEYPGGTFTGILVITEENYLNKYEVYWYLYLLDEQENQMTLTSGALALQTTVTVAYKLPISLEIEPGNYRLLVRTYDGPKENPVSNQLGMDEKWVKIEEAPPIDQAILGAIGNVTFIAITVLMTFILFFIAFISKRWFLLSFGIALGMLSLVLSGLIPYNIITIFGIILVSFSVLLFMKYYVFFKIKSPYVARLIGIVLMIIGLVIYVGVI